MENLHTEKTVIKLLCIGSPEWCQQYVDGLMANKESNKFIYKLECISDFSMVEIRLQANSYDLLLINYNETKNLVQDPFKYSKLAFAMSRPSVLICKSIFSYLKCKFIQLNSTWFKKLKFARNLIHIQTAKNINYTINNVKTAKEFHNYIEQISSMIFNTYINE